VNIPALLFPGWLCTYNAVDRVYVAMVELYCLSNAMSTLAERMVRLDAVRSSARKLVLPLKGLLSVDSREIRRMNRLKPTACACLYAGRVASIFRIPTAAAFFSHGTTVSQVFYREVGHDAQVVIHRSPLSARMFTDASGTISNAMDAFRASNGGFDRPLMFADSLVRTERSRDA
jgi:hypothetical protein